MMKLILAILAFEAVFINCSPVEHYAGYVGHAVQNSASAVEQAAHAAEGVIAKTIKEDEDVADISLGRPGKAASTSSVTVQEQNLISQNPQPGPIAYLPSFIQGFLPPVVTQTIAQLASYIPGFQRSGVMPQPNLPCPPYPFSGYVGYYPSYSGYPGYLSQSPLYYSGQPGYAPGKPGSYPGHIGYFQGDPEQRPPQPGYYPGHPGYIPSRADYYSDQPEYPPFQRYPPGYGIVFPQI